MRNIIIIVAAITLGVESGLELNITGYIQKFVTGHRYGELTGAYMLSALIGCYTFSRGISAIVASRIPMLYILCFSLTLMPISIVILQVATARGEGYVWLGFSIFGLGAGPFYAGMFSFVEKDIKVTTKITGTFVFISSIFSIIDDLTVGKLVEKYLASYNIYNFISIGLTIPGFIILRYLLVEKRTQMVDIELDPIYNVS